MIAWWWIPIAFLGGAIIGVFLLAFVAACSTADQDMIMQDAGDTYLDDD